MARNRGRYSNVKRGYALDLADDNYYASGWERDFARFLNLMVEWGVYEGWEYEPETFLFTGNGYKRGPWSYKPDFCARYRHDAPKAVLKTLQDMGFEHAKSGVLCFMEVKGQELGSDGRKWKRFRAHTGYPLEIVKKDKMRMIQIGFAPLIKEWESHIRG
jgi:hypothetical protein